MQLLFSYGTLRREDVQLSTFGRLLKRQEDELPGFERSRVRNKDQELAARTGRTRHANVVFNGTSGSPQPFASGNRAWVYLDARSVPTGARRSIQAP